MDVVSVTENPAKFYGQNNGNMDWNHTQYNNLWGNAGTAASWNGDNNGDYGVKTLFDTCPPGWKVAPRNTWDAFYTTPGTVNNNGISVPYDGTNTAFYPTVGSRIYNYTLDYAHQYGGSCWSSSPNQLDDVYSSCLHIAENDVYMDAAQRSFGMAVRCARER
jgi:hypothetical protein